MTIDQTSQPIEDHRLVLNPWLRDCIADRLTSFKRKSNTDTQLRSAAVALTLVDGERDNTAHFILTRRPKHMHQHGGQFALPGGKREANESAIQTSLRELHEEIGIDIKEYDVLGMLDDYQTRSGFNITPVVVWAGVQRKLRPDPNEIEHLFRIPLVDLKAPNIPIIEHTAESEFPVLSTPLATLGHQIFAPTAAFLYQFREVVLFHRPTRVAHLDQPKFAWQ